jgi:hypothetical protein
MKKCSRCKKEKKIEEFNFKFKSTGQRQLQCRECTRLLIKNHYNSNREYYLKKTRKRNSKLKLVIQGYLEQYLSVHPCVDCGEPDIAVLEFDHKGEVKKFKAVAQLLKGRYSLEIVKKEIEKCEVRCANCHRRKTAKQFKWYKIKHALVV